jgi:Bpu10I restriction endonuclease
MLRTPHKDKLVAAINNPKSARDVALLQEALAFYEDWHSKLANLTSSGKQRVLDATILLNEYKDFLEVELIAGRGSDFLKRQKGQLKLDNSIMEEFLIHLVHPSILTGLPSFTLDVGPHTAFMTFAFRPSSIASLDEKPEIVVKSKDQDFTIGKTLHYKLSPDSNFSASKTAAGEMFLSVLSAEVKVNFDKTMFQECCGTAARLKQGCPSAKYYVLVEFLDMEPEDSRLTDVDNVFLLRHAKRLPSNKRSIFQEVKAQHKDYPIDGEVIFKFVEEIQSFVNSIWHDPEEALRRGSFV